MTKVLRVILLAAVSLWAVPGCTPNADGSGDDLYARFQDEDPAVRIQAIHQAGCGKDKGAVPYLVDRLTDSEETARFFAIIALEEITGTTMGWKYYDPPAKRAEAVNRWRGWLTSGRRDGPTTQDARSEK